MSDREFNIFRDRVVKGLVASSKNLIKNKIRFNRPIAIIQDNRVKVIQPEDIK